MEYNFKGTDLELIFGNKTKREIEEIIRDLKQKAKISEKITTKIQYSLFLGRLYRYGFGVKKDYKEAVKWFKKALKTISSHSSKNEIEYLIGVLYLENDCNLKLNPEKAINFLTKAKEHGSIEALYKLGCLYRDGEIIDKDYQKAISFFEEAHKKGSSDATYELGLFYYTGFVLPLDKNKARELFKKSEKQENIRAKIILDLIGR